MEYEQKKRQEKMVFMRVIDIKNSALSSTIV